MKVIVWPVSNSRAIDNVACMHQLVAPVPKGAGVPDAVLELVFLQRVRTRLPVLEQRCL